MADVFTKAKRSEVMSRIRSRGNRDTELALAKLLRRHEIKGWRRQTALVVRSSRREEAHSCIRKSVRASSPRLLRVKVDFVFRQVRLAVFVDGCFWHGCPKHCNPNKWLKKSAMLANNPPSPKGRLRRTGRAFWRRKLSANKRRDALVTRTLRRAGWRVVRVWEHELARKIEARLIRKLRDCLK